MEPSFSTPIFVSGGTGFLASHIIKLLLDQNHKVRASVRSLLNTAKSDFLFDMVPSKKLNLELVEAELTNPQSWLDALKGCEYVLHIATPNPQNPPKDENELIKPAVEGTLNVLNAALVNKCKKVVITSTGYTIIIGNEGKICTEDDWADISRTSHYRKSKILAEKATWEFYETHKKEIQIVVVHPSLVIGPAFSVHNNSSEKLLAELLSGSFPAIPDVPIGLQVIDVRDVAIGHIKALFVEETNGKRFILTKEKNLFFSEIVQILTEEFEKYGYKFPKNTASKETIIQSGNSVAIKWASMGGMKFQLSNRRSIEELGMSYRDVKTTLIDMAYSIIKNGLAEDKINKK